MLVQLTEIPEEGLELQIDDVAWFPDDEIRRIGELQVRIFLQRRREREELIASGTIALVYVFNCDRCLEEYSLPHKIEFELKLEKAVDTGPEEKEYEFDSNEMDVFCYEDSAVDVGALLEQQVFLALPAKMLCREDCLGLCAGCGSNLNLGACDCADKSVESPFSILERLRNK